MDIEGQEVAFMYNIPFMRWIYDNSNGVFGGAQFIEYGDAVEAVLEAEFGVGFETYFVDGSESPILPASIDCTISSSSP